MPKKTVLAAAIVVGALVAGGSLGFAAPAFASPTPTSGPATTITNLAVAIDNTSGRQLHVQYNYSIADPSLSADSIVEVTAFGNCDTPTVIDRDVPLASPGGGISLYVNLPAQGFVRVEVYSSNGASAPLVTAPAFASDTPVDANDFGAAFIPDDPATTGSIVIGPGNEVGQANFQLYANGSPSASVVTVPGCGENVLSYAADPGTVLTLHEVDGDFDAATFTIPGGVTQPTDPPTTDPATADPASADPATADPATAASRVLASTGVGPDSWYAGGLALAALAAGVILLLILWLVRRRSSAGSARR